MIRHGVAERVAMQLAGHRTRTVFDRYAIVSQTNLAAAVAKLDQAAPEAGRSQDALGRS